MKKIVLFLLIGFFVASSYAQSIPAGAQKKELRQEKKREKREHINELIRLEEEGEIVYHKQGAFGVKLATDGYGIGYEYGKFKGNRKSVLFSIELSEKKHPKEKREGKFDNSQLRVNYIAFGKTNTFYQARLGAAMQQVIGGKGNKNGVSVSAIYGGGLTMGMQKPYVVQVYNQTNDLIESTYPEIIEKEYYEVKARGLAGGWNQLKVRPGAYAKTALRFDYGRLNETVTAIEVGLSAEYYPTAISQMAYNDSKSMFFNAYLALLLGRRK